VWGNRVSPRPRPAGAWGDRVSPCPHPVGGSGRAAPSRRGVGKPGFPTSPPGGRVWEGCALTQGCGETGFPHSPAPQGHGEPGFPMPPPGGRVWEGCALTQGCGETGFPHSPACGRVGAARGPYADAGRRPAHPGPGPWEGLGGWSPPGSQRMFIPSACGEVAWTADVKACITGTQRRRSAEGNWTQRRRDAEIWNEGASSGCDVHLVSSSYFLRGVEVRDEPVGDPCPTS